MLLGFAATFAWAADIEVSSFQKRFLDPQAPLPLAPDLPFSGHLGASLPLVDAWEDNPPAAFAPHPDGSVLLLKARPPRLVRMRGEKILSNVPLRGPQFDPEQTALIDLVAHGSQKVLVLDQASGSFWEAGLDGKVSGRHGLFLAPTSIRNGPRGQVVVSDPGNRSVVVFDSNLKPLSSRKGLGITPGLTSDNEIPFFKVRPDASAAIVGLLSSQGAKPVPQKLATLWAPKGKILLSTQLLGVPKNEIVFLNYAGSPDVPQPEIVQLVRIATTGPERGRVRTSPLPATANRCLECGPTYKLGPQGKVWMYVVTLNSYTVLQMNESERQ